MPVITVWNRKGGPGKTTLSWTLGMANEFQPTVLVDMDTQQSLTTICGVPIADQTDHALTDALQGRRPVKDAIRQVADGVRLIPGDTELDYLQDVWRMDERPELVFRRLLQALANAGFTVIVDAAPGATLTSRMALAAADHVLIPVLPGVQAADGLRRALHVIQTVRRGDAQHKLPAFNPALSVLGVVINGMSRPTAAQNAVVSMIDKVCEVVGIRRLQTVIRSRIAWEEAQIRQRPIWQAPEREAGAAKADAASLVQEIKTIIEKEEGNE